MGRLGSICVQLQPSVLILLHQQDIVYLHALLMDKKIVNVAKQLKSFAQKVKNASHLLLIVVYASLFAFGQEIAIASAVM